MHIVKAFSAAVIALALSVTDVSAGGNVKGAVKCASAKKKTNAVIYIDAVNHSFPAPKKNAIMDQKHLVFEPHVLPVLQGTSVDFLNSDDIRHNVFSPSQEKYNMGTWPTGEIKSRVFDKTGVYVQLCNVHPEMEGFIVVLQNPYYCLTGSDGLFVIKDVPAGTYTLKIWQEKLKKQQEMKITVTDGQETVADFNL